MIVEDLISQLSAAALAAAGDAGRLASSYQALGDELLALQAIYDVAPLKVVSLYRSDASSSSSSSPTSSEQHQLSCWHPGCTIRLALDLPLDLASSSNTNAPPPPSLRLSITLPPLYPYSTSPPQLQLLDRFIGDHQVDSSLFGRVLRTFLHHTHEGSSGNCGSLEEGVWWQPGEEGLYEGCENVKAGVEKWYKEQQSREEERRRSDPRAGLGAVVVGSKEEKTGHRTVEEDDHGDSHGATAPAQGPSSSSRQEQDLVRLVSSKKWTSTSPLVERKSTFIGHAVRLDRPDEVPLLLQALLHLYPRIQKATHPLMRAWVCTESDQSSGGNGGGRGRKVVHRDCDDDGESAAGGRLAHLLEMLHLENILVVVTRYYGGVQLGADRFKLINRVARDALELAGLLST